MLNNLGKHFGAKPAIITKRNRKLLQWFAEARQMIQIKSFLKF